ncbi:MAG: PDZ domain-containing protein, partial [Erysipelothrix sp.]|nr:PDZ domain-containing protein [Erysipelothrix sp.]
IDDTKIESFKQFRQILYSKKIGDTINVKLMRKNQSVTIAIKLQ